MNSLNYHRKGEVVIIRPAKYINNKFTSGMRKLIDEQSDGKPLKVLFNLEKCELINSHGVAGFHLLGQHLRNGKDIMALCGVVSLMVKDTLQETGVYYICDKHIYETEAEALAALGQGD